MASMNFMLKLVTYNNIIILQIRLKKKNQQIFLEIILKAYMVVYIRHFGTHLRKNVISLFHQYSLTSSSLRTMSLTCYLIDCTAAAIAIYIPI